jgi:alanyl-tRNA synthetase
VKEAVEGSTNVMIILSDTNFYAERGSSKFFNAVLSFNSMRFPFRRPDIRHRFNIFGRRGHLQSREGCGENVVTAKRFIPILTLVFKNDSGYVSHVGTVEFGRFAVGNTVLLNVNEVSLLVLS